MTFKTADLLDDNEDKPLQVVQPGFNNYGGRSKFAGEIVTIKIYEDNSLVRELVAEDGKGKVLVVDGGGSTPVSYTHLDVYKRQTCWYCALRM